MNKSPISILQELSQIWQFPAPLYRECEGNYQEFGTEVTLHLPPLITTPGPSKDCKEEEVLVFKALGRTKKLSKTKVAQVALDYITEHHKQLLETPEPPQDADLNTVAMPPIWKKGEQANPQRVSSLNQDQLARETEVLSHNLVTLDMARLIQSSRTNISMSQKDLASKINEKPSVVMDYEAGRAIPNQQLLAKMERALGVHLRGEKAGQPKLLGRGRGK